MKKSKLLILAIAALSSVAFAAVGCDNLPLDNPSPAAHTEHTYSWKSDDDGHWQECSGCDSKTESAAHVDVVVNATQAEGEDGHCDVCDRVLKKTVTFNLNGKGDAAPAAQKVEYGSKAQAPAALLDGDYIVVGWYTDAACSEGKAFDFDSAVTADVTLYAKWEENTEPGATAKYAFVLNKGVQNLQSIGSTGKLYYKFTAEAEGRYTISLGAGNSAKCRFTTDKDDNVYYGNGCAAAAKHLDLEADDEVIIIVSCEEELATDVKVTALVNDCTNEDLPQDKYLAGEYMGSTSGGTMTIQINRDNKTVTLSDNDYPYTYVGGKADTLYFTVGGETEYKLKYNAEDGKYYLTYNNAFGEETVNKLAYQEPQEPIAVAKFSGKYEPEAENGDEITEIVIYQSGNGYLMQDGYKKDCDAAENAGAVYNQTYNRLCYLGMYYITVNLGDDGSAVSINVSGGYIDGTVVYTRMGDSGVEIPKHLAIPDGDYAGNLTFTLTKSTNGGFISMYDAWISITDYDSENALYTISYEVWYEEKSYTYNLKVVDEVTLELYDTEDDTLVDTLVRFVPVFNTLPNGTAVVDTATVAKSMYWCKAEQAGWYKIEWDDMSLHIFGNLDENDPTNTNSGVELTSGDAVYFEQGGILGLYFGWYDELPSSVTITVSTTTAPAGRAEDNPLALENGTATINNMDNKSLYYFSFTAPAAGSYLINVSYVDDWGDTYYNLHYTMKGEDYGFVPDPNGWDDIWYKDMSADYPYAKITLAANEALLIIADRKGSYTPIVSSIKVTVFEDYSANATEIDVANAPTGTLEAGLHKADLSAVKNAVSIKLTSDQDMTVTVFGNELKGKELTLNSSQLASGFKLECDGTVNYAVLSVTVYTGTLSVVEWGETINYSVTLAIADDYSIVVYNFIDLYEAYEADLIADGDSYTFEYVFQGWDYRQVTITINDDGTVTVVDGDNGNATLSALSKQIIYTDGYYVFTFESELADMEVGDTINGTYSDGEAIDIQITKTGDNEYSYTAGTDYANGTFTLGVGCINVNDDYYGEFTLNRQ